MKQFVAMMLTGIATGMAGHAGIVSQNWRESKLHLQLEDGAAEIEWISTDAFRVARSWGGALPPVGNIAHYPVLAALEGAPGTPHMQTRDLSVDVDREALKLRVRNGDNADVAEIALAQSAGGVEVRFTPIEKVYGLMGGSTGRLNLRGEKLDRSNGFFMTSNGYGVLVRDPAQCRFDLEAGAIQAEATHSVDFVFYYGPTPKEILDQHQKVTGKTELSREALAVLRPEALPKEATRLPPGMIDGWPALAQLVRTVGAWSLSAVLYPAFDAAAADRAPLEVKQRAADLAAVLPLVYRASGNGGVDIGMRQALTPYLLTYLREAHDRGYPLIRPFPMEFSRDAGMDRQSDIFMLGDELLVAPVVSPEGKRRLELPRGLWTDLRTNVEYRGNQPIEVEAPAGRVPLLARNGSVFPLAGAQRMELHYFPSLGGEFFLWEPELEDNSQFHAAPAGDFMRVEIETKVPRTYQWVIHHTKIPREVAEDSGAYARVANRAELRPGAWWHDDGLNNLHIVVQAEKGSDRIVNISF